MIIMGLKSRAQILNLAPCDKFTYILTVNHLLGYIICWEFRLNMLKAAIYQRQEMSI
jgi:hypothetical protein